ncbi:MAG TPA: 1-phosphofructokinase, partial [Propionibacteriaceae bacterium]|nr:1-phosphofructokinase [Propionibacteriaceae bacterium]
VTADQVVHAIATIETPLSTVGAGAGLLAGVLHSLAGGGSPTDALAAGVRWGAAAVTLPGSRVPGPDDLAPIRVDVDPSPDLARSLT